MSRDLTGFAALFAEAQHSGDPEVIAEAEFVQAAVQHGNGEYARSQRSAARAYEQFKRLDGSTGAARTALVMARNHWSLGAFPDAIHWADIARETFARHGDFIGESDAVLHASFFHRTHGSLAASERLVRRAMSILDSAGEVLGAEHERALTHARANTRVNTGLTLSASSRHREALDEFALARELYESLDHHLAVADCDLNAGSLLAEIGDLEPARAALTASLDRMTLHAASPHRTAAATLALARVSSQRGSEREARTLAATAREIYSRPANPNRWGVAQVAHFEASLAVSSGAIGDGERLFEEAHDAFADIGDMRSAVVSAWERGRLAAGSTPPDFATAFDWWVPALLLAEAEGADFPNPRSRAQWRARLDGWTHELLQAAVAADVPELVADVVEAEINRLVYVATPASRGSETGGRDHGDVELPPERDENAGALQALTLSEAMVEGGGDLPSQAPPVAVRAYGRVTLDTYRRRAYARYEIASRGTLHCW